MIISAAGREITLADVIAEIKGENARDELSEPLGDEYGEGPEIDLEAAVNDYEKGLIRYALDKYGSTRKAARAVGISQTQLVRKKKKYGI